MIRTKERYEKLLFDNVISLISAGRQGEEEDVRFHAIFHEIGDRDADGHPHTWRAIQTNDTPLEFFNE